MQNLLNKISVQYVDDAVTAANNTDSDSAGVDTQGYEGVIFMVPIVDSVATGVATLTISQNTSNSTSGMAALSGAVATATSATNDDLNGKMLIVDVYRPRERYLFSTITSATANIAFGATIAIPYGAHKQPVTQLTAEVADSAVVTSPAES